MNAIFLLLPIIISILIPPIIKMINFKSDKLKSWITFSIVLLTSILTIILVIIPPSDKFMILKFTDELNVYLKLDGLGRIFAFMVAILWPFAYQYALGYMKHEERKDEYFMFYIMTFGVVLGICFSGNLVTMYLFYEILTLITLPLISHANNKEAKRASRGYLYISLFGSALAFMGLVILQTQIHTTEFNYGGNLMMISNVNVNLLLFAYLLTFIGFGVKAAIFPLHGWLPRAGVAPTPTTALLHAVAVVKAGAFAIMRTTYYNFGHNFIANTYAQTIVMIIAIITIVFGSAMALKQMHLKRRLAYSTCANISYILLGVTMMSDAGLQASVIHLLFHSFTKISLFFAAGIMMHEAKVTNIDDMDGLYKKMPITVISFLLAGLSLIGIPGFAGFLSKWYLASAAFENGSVIAIIGVFALLISALLTSVYIITILVRTFVNKPKENASLAKDGNRQMLIPTLTFALMSLVLGIFGNSFISVLLKVLEGVI